MHRRYVSALFGLAAIGLPAAAAAQSNIVIMKVESADANPDVVAALTRGLEASIRSHPDYGDPTGSEMTISELAVTAGCGRPDAACMKQLSAFIPGEMLVFARVSAAEDGHTFSLQLFDFAQGVFVRAIDEAPVSAERSLEVAPLIADWLIYGPVGELQVSLDGGSAPVLFNGRPLGDAPATFTDLPLGEHEVAVRGDDGVQTSTVILRRGEVAQVSFALGTDAAPPVARNTSDGPSIAPGVVLLGVGVAGIGLGIVSSLQVDKANASNQRLGDEGYLDPSTGAFVNAGEAQRARDNGLDPQKIADRGKLFQTLQYVGYGAGAVSLGVGAFLIARALSGGSESQSAWQLDLAPSRDGFSASLSTSF